MEEINETTKVSAQVQQTLNIEDMIMNWWDHSPFYNTSVDTLFIYLYPFT